MGQSAWYPVTLGIWSSPTAAARKVIPEIAGKLAQRSDLRIVSLLFDEDEQFVRATILVEHSDVQQAGTAILDEMYEMVSTILTEDTGFGVRIIST